MKIDEAIPEQSITNTLDDEIDISRGDMIVHDNDTVQSVKSFKSTICWLSETSLNPGRSYLIMHTTRSSKAKISQIHHKVNVNTLAHEDANDLQTNEIAEVTFKLAQPLIVDQYEQNRSTGAFILVDESTYHPVAAGMILNME
jgi:sulfate adenylyltransferase subunit 1